MQIKNLVINNFRSIDDLCIPLPQYSIMVGRNNSGKSNILSSINLLLEGAKSDLTTEDFHRNQKGVADSIIIEALITGVENYLPLCSEQHRSKIQACIDNDSIRIRRTAQREPLELGKIEIWQPAKSEFGTPTGIDSAFKQFLPEIIFIEAFKDPSSEAQSNKSTSILSKLLKQIVEQVGTKIEQDIKNALSMAQRRFNIIEEDDQLVDERPEELKRIQGRINQHVQEIFSGADARLIFKLPNFDAMMATAGIELRDHKNGPWTSPALKGQGFQRALYVALLEALADELRHGKGEEEKLTRPFILLFEEPEIFLHPALQREIGNILNTISRTNQVVIATHSPVLVTPQRIDNVIIVKQVTNGEIGVHSLCLCPDSTALPDSDDKQLASLLKYASSAEFLFSDYVIVVEGPSDRELMNASWTRLKQEDLKYASRSLAVIDAGSKAVVPVWVHYLKSLGLSAVGVVDLDFLWDGAGKVLKSSELLSQMASRFWEKCTERGYVEEINGGHKIQGKCKIDAFAILTGELQGYSARIREELQGHALWVLENGEIESYFGLSQSSKGQFTSVSHKILQSEIPVPDEIKHILLWGSQ